MRPGPEFSDSQFFPSLFGNEFTEGQARSIREKCDALHPPQPNQPGAFDGCGGGTGYSGLGRFNNLRGGCGPNAGYFSSPLGAGCADWTTGYAVIGSFGGGGVGGGGGGGGCALQDASCGGAPFGIHPPKSALCRNRVTEKHSCVRIGFRFCGRISL